MTFSRLQWVARNVTTLIVLAATVGLAGCERNAVAVTSAPAGEATGLPPDRPAMLPAAGSHAVPGTEKTVAAAEAALTVTVSLSPAVAKKAAADDIVYIFARAVQGQRMPLAIVRKQVKDLPATVVLDDSSGMLSGMKLSSASEVIVIARVSKSGNPSAQAGDLEGRSAVIKPGVQTVALSIASVLSGKE
jgi:cytochrome c-type biogenesis protein CcmH